MTKENNFFAKITFTKHTSDKVRQHG